MSDDLSYDFDAPREEPACWRVWLRSTPGMWATYDGYVDLYAPRGADEDSLFREAVRRLSRSSFPDRPSLASWQFDSAELLP
ncbi:hypothetical protein AB4Y36_38200 [Paraburkholderia sp. BR10936]|uniref:hypothetical protein n=1 Tax=Paraburkholderia sp. BR10936 TaxID=3236993 RepID=UPI0034D22F7B